MIEDVWLVEKDFLVHKLPISLSSEQASRQMHINNSNRNSKQANLRRTKEIQQYGLDLIQAPYSSLTWTSAETKYGDAFIDGDGQGTHCACGIGAIGDNDRGVIGVNPDPTKFSLHINKALNAQGIGTTSSLIQAIEGCMESGSKVISMSLGGGPNSDIFREIYKEAYDEGILIFGAAGNQGSTDHGYPVSFPHVVSVGAVNQNGKRAPFSNFNQVELMAPGVEVLSTYPNDSYFTLSGTSMATPYVAGVAALVWGYFPECSNRQIRNVLALTAKTMSKNNFTCKRRMHLPCWKSMTVTQEARTPIPYRMEVSGDVPSSSSSLSIPLLKCPPVAPRMIFAGNSKLTRTQISMQLKHLGHWRESSMIPVNYVEEKHYSITSDCLVDGSYEFTVYDEFCDGINAPGHYTIYLNGEVLATNSNFGSSETTRFLIESSTPVEVSQPTDEWVNLMYEDFIDGLGPLTQGG
eukprot:g10879.t1 g10879   contig40:23589-25203(-)